MNLSNSGCFGPKSWGKMSKTLCVRKCPASKLLEQPIRAFSHILRAEAPEVEVFNVVFGGAPSATWESPP